MLRFCLAVLSISGGILQAQPMPSPPSSAGSLFKAEGSVINAQTGRPVPHALVEAYVNGKLAVLTDSEGRFTLDKVPQGTLMVTVRKPGFFTPGGTENNAAPIRVEVGPKMGKVQLRLVPESAIAGQVTDRDGGPLEGAVVEALVVRFFEGRGQLTPVRNNVHTDEDGNFRMAGLPAGRYYVLVKAGTVARRILGAQSTSGPEMYPALIYYPSAGDFTGASPIDLAAGQRVHLEFTLKRGPAFKVAGVITGLSAFKQVNAPVMMDDSGRPLFGVNRWDNQTGIFEFPPLPAGTYQLQVYATDADSHSAWVKEKVTLDKNVANLALTLEPGVTIPVVVRSEMSADPRASTCLGSFPTKEGVNGIDCSRISAMVTLTSVDPVRSQVPAQPRSKDDPSLVLSGVMPGAYVARVMPMGSGYVSSLRCGDADLLRDMLIVPANGQVPAIEIVVRNDGGSINVHVRSDKPVESGRILLIPEFAPNLPPSIVYINPGIDTEYGGLAPGNYKVFAFDAIEGIEYGNPDAMAKYADKAGTVTITAKGRSSVSVDLIRMGDVN
jgi:hypothetical protein